MHKEQESVSTKNRKPPKVEVVTATQRIYLNNHTARTNELLKVHWRVAQQLRQRDDAWIALTALSQCIKLAQGKRRVSLVVTLGPRQSADEDCWWKSVLDALKNSGLIKNDSSRWCKLGDVRHHRGKRPAMEIILEDLEYRNAEPNNA